MTRRFYANAAPQQTLASPITSGATAMTVAGTYSGYPVSFPFSIALDKGTASFEVITVSAIAGATATIARGQDGTTAVSHPAGATVDFVVTAKDFDEANAHVNASTGVHGVSGSVVGTSDAQTLSNKTVAAPILTGTATGAGAINIAGAVTSAAAVSGASVASTGAVTGVSAAITGPATAGSLAANANGTVTGVFVPKSYTNEAAATAALPSPVVGTQVWLTNSTAFGSFAGLFFWTGTVWNPVTPGYIYGDTTVGSSVVLSTTSAFAGAASVTFTLGSQRRVKIETLAGYQAATAPAHGVFRPGYNTGSSPVIGSFVGVGQASVTTVETVGANGAVSSWTSGTVVLAAGTYTAYMSITRVAGSATDVAANFYVGVFDAGPV